LVLKSGLFEPDLDEVAQKVRFPLRNMPGGMAGVEYGTQPKSPVLT
jgi:hypothetical protein